MITVLSDITAHQGMNGESGALSGPFAGSSNEEECDVGQDLSRFEIGQSPGYDR